MPSLGQPCPRCRAQVHDATLALTGGELQTLYYPDPDCVTVTLSCRCVFARRDPDFAAALAVVWRSWELPPMPPG